MSADLDPNEGLPPGWSARESAVAASGLEYENIHTGETVAWIPTRGAQM